MISGNKNKNGRLVDNYIDKDGQQWDSEIDEVGNPYFKKHVYTKEELEAIREAEVWVRKEEAKRRKDERLRIGTYIAMRTEMEDFPPNCTRCEFADLGCDLPKVSTHGGRKFYSECINGRHKKCPLRRVRGWKNKPKTEEPTKGENQ